MACIHRSVCRFGGVRVLGNMVYVCRSCHARLSNCSSPGLWNSNWSLVFRLVAEWTIYTERSFRFPDISVCLARVPICIGDLFCGVRDGLFPSWTRLAFNCQLWRGVVARLFWILAYAILGGAWQLVYLDDLRRVCVRLVRQGCLQRALPALDHAGGGLGVG